MAKLIGEKKVARKSDSGNFVKRQEKPGAYNTLAGSVLTQRPSKPNAESERVIKEASSAHRDALKRLVNR